MVQEIYIDGIDRAYTVRLFDGEEVTSSAETGTVNVGRIEIDDPEGTLDVVPLKAAHIIETDAPSGNQRVWTGYVFNLTIDRGGYKTAAGRVWHADCVDVNFDLSRRFFISANAFRPAETDVARLDWILNGNLATVGLVYQGSLTNLTDNVKNLDADDLRYVTPMEALANIAPQCGKRAFAFYNETTDKVELFYDLANAAVNTSSSKISNDLDDAGSGVYYPYLDASLDRKGEEIASTWILNYVGGHERQDRADTLATYGEHWFTSDSSRIGRATTAAAWVSQTLAAHDHPEDTVTVTIETETANVNDIKEGQRFQNKYTHLPDLDAFTYRRVISRTLKRIPGGRLGKYLVQLTLDNNSGTALGGGGGTGGFPAPPGTTTHFYSGSFSILGDDLLGDPAGEAATSTVLVHDTTYTYHIEISWDAISYAHELALRSEATILGVYDYSIDKNSTDMPDNAGSYVFDGTFTTPDVAHTAPSYRFYGKAAQTPHGHDVVGSVNFWVDPAGWVAAEPPKRGQWVGISPPEVVTMSGADGTTVWPFADGSLIVLQDGFDQSTHIASYDGAAGTFTLDYTPGVGSTITVRYQGR